MPFPNDVGLAQQVLVTSVARAYYLERKSKVQIGEELRLSRFKVARLLDDAHDAGIVRIEIGHTGPIDLDMSAQLREVYGLQHAVVVDTPEEHAASLRRDLGAAAAQLVTEVVSSEDVLGLAWARSVGAMCSALRSLPACTVVQLTGALPEADVPASSIDLVREAAQAAGGPAYYFYAPLIVPEATTARALRQQPEVARALAQIPSVSIAAVGVGAWAPGQSTLYDAVEPKEKDRITKLGVCADVSGVLLDAEGNPISAPLTKRMIGITAEQLAHVGNVVAIAYGVPKTMAVRAAITGGFVTSLVTHTPMARELLARR